MTLQAEQIGETVTAAEEPPQLSAVDAYKTGALAAATAVHFTGRRPRSVQPPAAQSRLLGMLRSTPPPTRDPSWRDNRACNNADPELFFPDLSTDQGVADAQVAKAILCKPCPVRGDCALGAFRNPQQYGIWGGFDQNERKSVQYAGLGEAMLADYPR